MTEGWPAKEPPHVRFYSAVLGAFGGFPIKCQISDGERAILESWNWCFACFTVQRQCSSTNGLPREESDMFLSSSSFSEVLFPIEVISAKFEAV